MLKRSKALKILLVVGIVLFPIILPSNWANMGVRGAIWTLALLSLVVLVVWGLVCLAQPVLGVLGVGGFALYVLWSNSAVVWTSLDPATDG